MSGPLINIVTRCSRKDKFLNYCLPSIESQTYKNYHHVITYETEDMKNFLLEHTDPSKTTLCKVFPMKKIEGLWKSIYYKQHGVFDDVDKINAKLWVPEEEGVTLNPIWQGGRTRLKHFPYNLYLIKAERKIKEGWVIYLDDDDQLKHEGALETLSQRLVSKDTLYVFNIYKQDEDLIYPRPIAIEHSITVFNEPPALGIGFGGSAFTYHSDYLDYTAWDEWSGSDWKTFQSLWYNIPNKEYIEEILVLVEQSGLGEK